MNTVVDAELEQVVAMATDYIRSFYSGTAEERSSRIQHVLHPDLAKRRASNRHDDGSFREITYARMAELAAASVNDDPAIKTPYVVKVLDITPTMASVRTDAHWGVDYMHLAKIDGEGQIVNVLWD